MIKIRILPSDEYNIFMCARVSLFAVHCNSYSDSHYHSLQFEYTFRRGLLYHNAWNKSNGNTNDQSVSLIPKRDPGITNFLIPDPGIENSIPGLQSLVLIIKSGARIVW